MRLVWLICFALLMALPSTAQTRRAFVVGVSEYEHVTDLPKTLNDVKGYETVFRDDLKFEVTPLINPDFDTFLNALSAFVETIEPGDQVVFVFSGHGWSDGAANHLAFSDAPLQSTELVFKRRTASLSADVLDELRKRNPSLVFAVIDACRDNPFDLGTRNVSKGLARIEASPGTVVMYAAGEGEKALERLSPDDPSPYSVFTRTLLPKLRNPATPLARILDAAKSETANLAQTISHPQRPAVYSDISIDFCFAASCPNPDVSLANAERKTAELTIDAIAQAASNLFETESGDHTGSLLMALQAVPAAWKLGNGRPPETSDAWHRARYQLTAALIANRLTRTFEGHKTTVSSVAFAPDGKSLATGSWDNTARLRNLQTGELVRAFGGHQGPVTSVAFAPDGKSLATGSGDNTARLWNLQTGELIRAFEGHQNSVLSVAFAPDGKSLATGSDDNTARLWNLQTGEIIRTFEGHGNYVSSVAFAPDGKSLATGSGDNAARLWNLQTGEIIRAFEGHGNYVSSVAFAPDGKSLATGSGDNTARLWNLQTGELIRAFEGHGNYVSSVAFAPDGKSLATGSGDNTARLWNLQTGELIRAFEGHGNYVTSVAFAPDGKSLATGSDDNTARLWNLQTGELVRTFEGQEDDVSSVAFAPDGKSLATGSGGSAARLWKIDAILQADAKSQVETACAALRTAGAPLAFGASDLKKFRLLATLREDGTDGGLKSPCIGFLPADAFK